MGIPTRSIQRFEEDLRQSTKKWTIIIFANAGSDSRAVEYVIRNFHELDVVSDDVDFYLPGFDLYNIGDTNLSDDELQWRNDELELQYPDFRKCKKTNEMDQGWDNSSLQSFSFQPLNEISEKGGAFCKIIDSPRLGPIVFNEAEFADFVMEFTRRKKGYVYLGTCQMLLVPVSNGIPDYPSTAIYDLDAVTTCLTGPSLDSFFHQVFHIIREASGLKRGYRIFFDLMGRKSLALQAINHLYSQATTLDYNRCESIITDVYLDMKNCLGWSLFEEYYFISYSSQNVTKAETLKRKMQDRGLHVWIAPDGIPQGREYSLVIPTALKLAKHFVLLLTPDSAKSRWVKRELDIAISNEANTKIKVLLADGFSVDDIRADNELMFYLNRVQVKYEYSDVIRNDMVFGRFVSE